MITAAARMAGGAAGSMISRTDRVTAWPSRGPDSTTGLRVRWSVAGPSAAQIGSTDARSASRPAYRPWACVTPAQPLSMVSEWPSRAGR